MRFRVHHPLSVSFFIASRAIHGARPAIADRFKAATSLLSCWRDEAAHGTVSEISEIEPHTALGRLVRFAQFICDNWTDLTGR
jgi:hypothetical protein